MKKWGVPLIGLLVLEGCAIAYDALWNESRIIRPIDGSYQFRPGDLPLLLATVLLVAGVLVLCVRFFWGTVKKAGQPREAGVARRIDPRWGWCGLAGLCGFIGIPAYLLQQQVWPFFFFVFFGFFGFFYEGKLSGTLMDERFREEQNQAQLKAYKTGFGLLWLLTWATALMGNHLRTGTIAALFTAASSLIIALVLFLNSYLLYKYDREGAE